MDSFLLAISPVSIGMCGKKTDVRTLCACALAINVSWKVNCMWWLLGHEVRDVWDPGVSRAADNKYRPQQDVLFST